MPEFACGWWVFQMEKGRKMALNIPVNLMNTVAPLSQIAPASDAIATATTVQPVSNSAGTRNAASGGSDRGDSSARRQQAAILKPDAGAAPMPQPDRAEPKSVVAA